MQRRRVVSARRGIRKRKASTGDILTGNTTPRRVRQKWRKYYDRLIQLRDEIQRRQSDLASDALQEQPSFSTHMADAGTDTYDRDFALGMLSSEQDAMYQIDQAIDRIRSGTYGICEMTGKKIEPDRLEAIPWTRFSAAAERQLEREGTRKRSRLGERETVPRSSTTTSEEEAD